MPLQNSGPIGLSEVAAEFGDTAPHSLSEFYGAAAGVPASGPIGIGNFYGVSAITDFLATITTNMQELNLRTWLISQGWNQTSAVTVTINTGVYIWSDNTATPALNMGGSYPGGLTLINNGFIIGKGGNGGYYTASSVNVEPTAGGPAIALTGPISIDNSNGYIGGGGGGGAHTSSADNGGFPLYTAPGGGGAGGGYGGLSVAGSGNSDNTAQNFVEGQMGQPGAPGQHGTYSLASRGTPETSITAFFPPGTGGGGGSGSYAVNYVF